MPILKPLPDSISRPERIEAVLLWVRQQHGVSEADILGRSRDPNIRRARCELWWRLRQLQYAGQTLSYPRIGRWFAKDHSTIVDGVRLFEDDLAAWCDVMTNIAAGWRKTTQLNLALAA